VKWKLKSDAYLTSWQFSPFNSSEPLVENELIHIVIHDRMVTLQNERKISAACLASGVVVAAGFV
jgi:hypothetical protein